MRNKLSGWIFVICVVILAIWLGPKIENNLWIIRPIFKDKEVKSPPTSLNKVMVSRVIDGDTIEISSGEIIRYIGVNTPETKDPRRAVGCFGKEAYEYNKLLVEGKEVVLEKDISDKDKYGRLLRYVWINDVHVNADLVSKGYALVSTYPPDVKYEVGLLDAEKIARENRRGLWEKCKQ